MKLSISRRYHFILSSNSTIRWWPSLLPISFFIFFSFTSEYRVTVVKLWVAYFGQMQQAKVRAITYMIVAEPLLNCSHAARTWHEELAVTLLSYFLEVMYNLIWGTHDIGPWASTTKTEIGISGVRPSKVSDKSLKDCAVQFAAFLKALVVILEWFWSTLSKARNFKLKSEPKRIGRTSPEKYICCFNGNSTTYMKYWMMSSYGKFGKVVPIKTYFLLE